MTWMDWLLLALVVLCGALALRSVHRAKKSSKCPGCSGGDCTACGEKKE